MMLLFLPSAATWVTLAGPQASRPLSGDKSQRHSPLWRGVNTF